MDFTTGNEVSRLLVRDPRLQEVAHQLLTRALIDRGLPAQCANETAHGFDSGNTALFVAGMSATMRIVAKVDESRKVLNEGLFLHRTAEDPALPEALRAALPQVYGYEVDGPPYGYVMEYLEGYELLSAYVGGEQTRHAVPELLTRLWTTLAEAYRATRSTRLLPNIEEDYIVRAEERLRKTAREHDCLSAELPVRIRTAGEVIELPPWREVVGKARGAARVCAPTFSTWVFGDPNLDNVLVREDGDGFSIKLIDPKEWGRGDWLFDATKIGHCLRVTHPVEAGHLAEEPRVSVTDAVEIAYELPSPAYYGDTERLLSILVEGFARGVGDSGWRERYELGIGSNLLGNVPRRLAHADPVQQQLGVVAFAEGLRAMWAGAQAG